MPTIVDYQVVLQTVGGLGLKCLHYNGGVFGWPSEVTVHHTGWMLTDDPTLAPTARLIARMVQPPAVATLSFGLIELWEQHLTGPMWIMPGSHWAYELTYGGQKNLAELLNWIGLSSDSLSSCTEAAAIAFDRSEAAAAGEFLTNLLQILNVTDFTAVFPEGETIALLHHHQQIWWSTPRKTQNQATVDWAQKHSNSTTF